MASGVEAVGVVRVEVRLATTVSPFVVGVVDEDARVVREVGMDRDAQQALLAAAARVRVEVDHRVAADGPSASRIQIWPSCVATNSRPRAVVGRRHRERPAGHRGERLEGDGDHAGRGRAAPAGPAVRRGRWPSGGGRGGAGRGGAGGSGRRSRAGCWHAASAGDGAAMHGQAERRSRAQGSRVIAGMYATGAAWFPSAPESASAGARLPTPWRPSSSTSLLREQRRSGRLYHEFIRTHDLSVGLYVLAAGGTDPPGPAHRGRGLPRDLGPGQIRVGDEDRAVGPGSVVFVGADVEHRFHDIEEELVVLVDLRPGRVHAPGRPPARPPARSRAG